MSSQKVSGLASAFESPKKPIENSGLTTLASRFDTTPPQEQPQLQSKISDLASRFSGTDRPIPQPALHIPSTPPPKLHVRSPVKESPVNSPSPTDPQLSKKVSDLSKAFSQMSEPGKSETFSAAHSAFEKASSDVSNFPKRSGSADGPSAGVAGVARTFERRDKNSKVSSHFETKLEKAKSKSIVEDKVDAFASVASRFECGVAGKKAAAADDEENPDAAKERFRDAAKMFGG